jgi:8-oxo-dGTP diphosphatase
MKGRWDLPGGFLEADEHPTQGVIRECIEEVGFNVEPIRILGIYMGDYGITGEREHILNIVFIAHAKDEVAKGFASDETQAVRWFAVDELPQKLAFDHNSCALQDYEA